MGVDFRTVLFGAFGSGLIPSGSDISGIGIAGAFVVFDVIVVAGFFDQAGFIKGFSAGGTGRAAAYLSFRVAVDFAGTRTGTVFGVTDFAAFPGSAAAVGTIIVSIRTAGFVRVWRASFTALAFGRALAVIRIAAAAALFVG